MDTNTYLASRYNPNFFQIIIINGQAWSHEAGGGNWTPHEPINAVMAPPRAATDET